MEFYANIKNTCYKTGEWCEGVWANNIDEARAGKGVCEAVMLEMTGQLEPEPEPVEPETPEVISLGTIPEVLEAVVTGEIEVTKAIALEKQGKARKTLISELEEIQAIDESI